jgi:hypothetical protein
MPIWENNVTHGTHQKSMNAKSHDLDLLGVSVLSVWAFAAETASLVPVELSRLCPCSPPWWFLLEHDLHDGCELKAENVGEYEMTGVFLKSIGFVKFHMSTDFSQKFLWIFM